MVAILRWLAASLVSKGVVRSRRSDADRLGRGRRDRVGLEDPLAEAGRATVHHDDTPFRAGSTSGPTRSMTSRRLEAVFRDPPGFAEERGGVDRHAVYN